MPVIKTLSIATDFSGSFNLGKFDSEIRATSHVVNFGGVSKSGDVVNIIGDSFADEPAVNAIIAAHQDYTAQELIDLEKERWKAKLFSPVTIQATCDASGLQITTNAPSVIVSDVYTVTADATLTKYVLMALVYRESTDDFTVYAFEKTDQEYAALPSGEHMARRLKEFSVIANGTDLVLEESYIG